MKNTIIYFIVCSLLMWLSVELFSQSRIQKTTRPQKFGGIAKEEKPISFYEEQSRLWKGVITSDPDEGEAWYYHYMAERSLLQLKEPELWANDKDEFYQRLDPILIEASNHIGNDFEYYFIKGLNSGGQSSIDALQQAYDIDPHRPEVYGWLFSYHVPRFHEDECADLAKRMLQSNIYSDANLKWNYNALVSTEKNSLIISNGDLDGIPKWVLQYGADVRKDVLVVNKWLLAYQDAYRETIYSNLHLQEPERPASTYGDAKAYADYLVVDLLKRSQRPAYISSGTSLQFFKENDIVDKMYLVGNVLKYSSTAFDNISVIRENIEEKYYLEYLLENFQHHHQDDIVRSQMNPTYLPALMLLKEHYQTIDNKEKYDHMTALIDKIIMDSGKKEEVMNWFNK